MTEKLLVPDIGDFENVEVIELLVKEGQEIKKNDPVITIESDKSSVEIPSNFEGKIKSLKLKVGDKVSEGDLILILESSNKEKEEKDHEKPIIKRSFWFDIPGRYAPYPKSLSLLKFLLKNI